METTANAKEEYMSKGQDRKKEVKKKKQPKVAA